MAKELILSGRVQGVFCRNYCSRIGRKLNIRGTASNLMDGTVQVLLESDDDEKVNDYIKALIQNTFNINFFGRIDNVKVNSYSGAIRGDYVF